LYFVKVNLPVPFIIVIKLGEKVEGTLLVDLKHLGGVGWAVVTALPLANFKLWQF